MTYETTIITTMDEYKSYMTQTTFRLYELALSESLSMRVEASRSAGNSSTENEINERCKDSYRYELYKILLDAARVSATTDEAKLNNSQ